MPVFGTSHARPLPPITPHRTFVIRYSAKTKGVKVQQRGVTRDHAFNFFVCRNKEVSHRTMRLISLCVAVFAAEIQSEQDMSECLSIYA